MTDGRPTEPSWDWSQPFDEDFVAAAPRREGSAADRERRAKLIARAHEEQRQAARTVARSPRERRGKRHFVPLLVAAGLLTAAVVLPSSPVHGLFSGGTGSQLALQSAQQLDAPPVPADAQKARLAPLPETAQVNGGYQRLEDLGSTKQSAVRWDPCRPIRYVVRPDGAPADGQPLLDAAFARLSAATGLVFLYDGTTTEAPDPKRNLIQTKTYGKRWAPVLVAWSEPSESPMLDGRVAGFAGPRPADPDGRGLRLVSGLVVLDAPQLAAKPDPISNMSVVLHELGHLAGLAHVEDPTDSMAPTSPRVTDYTAGARAGLRDAGRGRCFN
ncbi:MAG: peptidase and matrixin and adamalysin [Frankiales bacterium]|nr:peptidase and matrixin and adamalysin [Frankiales bacterium]